MNACPLPAVLGKLDGLTQRKKQPETSGEIDTSRFLCFWVCPEDCGCFLTRCPIQYQFSKLDMGFEGEWTWANKTLLG